MMNEHELGKWAREAGYLIDHKGAIVNLLEGATSIALLAHIAKRAAEKEREECEKLCFDEFRRCVVAGFHGDASAAHSILEEIRARKDLP